MRNGDKTPYPSLQPSTAPFTPGAASLVDVVKAYAQAFDADDYSHAVLREILRTTSLRGGTVVLKDASGVYRIVAMENAGERFERLGATDTTLLTSTFTPLEKVEGPVLVAHQRDIAAGLQTDLPFNDVVWVPIRFCGQHLGFLCLGEFGHREWAEPDMAWLAVIGELFGVILHHARQIEEARQEGARRVRLETENELRDRIAQVLGYSFVRSSLGQNGDQGAPAGAPHELELLTAREIDVLREVTTGASNQEIAE